MTDVEAQDRAWTPLGFVPGALVWLLLIAALSSAALLATQGERYLLWVVLLAMGLGLFALELRLRSRETKTGVGSSEESSSETLLGFPAHLATETERLHRSFEPAELESIKAEVDELVQAYVDPLTDARDRLGAQLGLSHLADLMTSFARGERLLNRAWSALTDEHAPEARQALADASAAFREAAEKAGRD